MMFACGEKRGERGILNRNSALSASSLTGGNTKYCFDAER